MLHPILVKLPRNLQSRHKYPTGKIHQIISGGQPCGIRTVRRLLNTKAPGVRPAW